MITVISELLQQYDPFHDHLKQGLRTAFACFVSMLVYHYYASEPGAFWVVLMAVLMMQTREGCSLKQQVLSVILCSVIVTPLSLVSGLLSQCMIPLAFYIAALGGLALAIGQKSTVWLQRSFFVFAVIIVSSGFPLGSVADVVIKANWMLLGAGIATLCSLLMINKPQKRIKAAKQLFLRNIDAVICRYCQLVCEGQLSAKKEEQLHQRRLQLIQLLAELQQLPAQTELQCKTIRLRKIIVALGNYRFLYQDEPQLVVTIYRYIEASVRQKPTFNLQLDLPYQKTIDQLVSQYVSLKHDVEYNYA